MAQNRFYTLPMTHLELIALLEKLKNGELLTKGERFLLNTNKPIENIHNHENKDLLDSLTPEMINNWNNISLDDFYSIDEINQLIDEINKKINNKSDLSHNHTIEAISGLQFALGDKANNNHKHYYNDIQNPPDIYLKNEIDAKFAAINHDAFLTEQEANNQFVAKQDGYNLVEQSKIDQIHKHANKNVLDLFEDGDKAKLDGAIQPDEVELLQYAHPHFGEDVKNVKAALDIIAKHHGKVYSKEEADAKFIEAGEANQLVYNYNNNGGDPINNVADMLTLLISKQNQNRAEFDAILDPATGLEAILKQYTNDQIAANKSIEVLEKGTEDNITDYFIAAGKDPVQGINYYYGNEANGYSQFLYTGDANGNGLDTNDFLNLGGADSIDFTNYYNKGEVDSHLNKKVDKVEGKGLSEENFSRIEKEKLAGLHAVATSGDYNDLINIPTNVSEFVNDANYATKTELENSLDNYHTAQECQALLDGKIDKVDGKGLSANDFTNELKTKLDGIEEGATKLTMATSDKLGGIKLKADGDFALDTNGNLEFIGGVAEHTHVYANITDVSTKVLEKDNTVVYVPTEDYHPATKLYVDSKVPEYIVATSQEVQEIIDANWITNN